LIASLCVYCGSSAGVNPVYRASAVALGNALADRGVTLVYGGGRVGLMGIVADACLAGGGHVIGIIPEFLRRHEVGHGAVSELIVVDSMHQRKQAMFDRADAFAMLPGGFGTLDEVFEMATWKQLGLHRKPIVGLDIEGYWAPFRELIDHVIGQGFARPTMRDLIRFVPSIDELLNLLDHPVPWTDPAIAPAGRG
jgi:uncharacterized protein (TIGR00730 family)